MAAANITGLWGHNFSNGNERLIAVWRGASMVYNGSQWIRGATLTSGLYAYMASLVDKVFLVNGTDSNWEYNGSYWTIYENTERSPIANFIISQGDRLYLLGIKINNGGSSTLSWPSRVWFSDLPNNNSITWGLEYGNNLTTTAGSAVVTSATAKFKTRNIKIGDPFFINESSAGNARSKPYSVQSIDSETQITLTEDITFTATSDIFWVGGNWFDVGTDDGDTGNGFGLTNNEVVIFKKNSVYRYEPIGKELRKIKDAPGAVNPRYVLNWGGYCYWLHSSGIYRTSGGIFERISGPIQEVFDEGTTVSSFTTGAGWVNKVENTINFALGLVTLADRPAFTNMVLTFDVDSNNMSYRDYDKSIITTAQWTKSNIAKVYFGDNQSGVHQLDTGTTFNGSDIPVEVELYPIYPAGEDAVVTFDRIRSYIKNGPDIQIFYKLIYKPRQGTDNVWDSDETWFGLKGSQIGDRVDWVFPSDARASGVKLKIVESSGDESFIWEKFTLYYSTASNF